ncbi:hypothetical protein FACS1894122_02840 [Alphaproteobacteria bacterium]|nr:hypothetical protein FACS1894122_02840 [Alphaproteobacteria bacterium]
MRLKTGEITVLASVIEKDLMERLQSEAEPKKLLRKTEKILTQKNSEIKTF